MAIKRISQLVAMNTQRFAIAFALIAATAGAAIALLSSRANDQPVGPTETALFSGGCFWGLQAAFDDVDGVVLSRVGYTGGDFPNPRYTQVVFGKTGHAEAVELRFDPAVVSFSELLQIHIDRIKPKDQTPGIDYDLNHSRAAVFVQNAEQRAKAQSAIGAKRHQSKHILLEHGSFFWEAEAEHQNYLANCAY